jgi:hypothetical protein
VELGDAAWLRRQFAIAVHGRATTERVANKTALALLHTVMVPLDALQTLQQPRSRGMNAQFKEGGHAR